MRYLLDTNMISDLVKNPAGTVAQHVRSLAPDSLCTTTIVAGELRYGVEKKASAELRYRVTQILGAIPVLPLDAACADAYGTIRAELESQGISIGVNDLWIAAHARTLGLVLVTHNTEEFRRVPGLQWEDWLA